MARPIYFYVSYLLPGPGTRPIRFVWKVHATLQNLCVRSFDVVPYGHQIHFGRFFGQPSRENTFSKKCIRNGNLPIIVDLQCPQCVFVVNHL